MLEELTHNAAVEELVDGGMHRYRLDNQGLMEQLRRILADRGYVVQVEPGKKGWLVETAWSRGAACGEIGSILYGLIPDKLVEIE